MNGQLFPSWNATWKEVWAPLAKASGTPKDIFCELVRHLGVPPRAPLPPEMPGREAFDEHGELVEPEAIKKREEYEEQVRAYQAYRDKYEAAVSDPSDRTFFKSLMAKVRNEAEAIDFVGRAYVALETYDDASLLEKYESLVAAFVRKYNLRYEVLDRCSLHTTIEGMFSKLTNDIRSIATLDDHLSELLADFEDAFRDLKTGRTRAKIKTCLQKQFCLIEALAARYPGVKGKTLGTICNELDCPHETIREVGRKLYGFRSDYPGLGHAGNAAGELRKLNMKDFVSLSLMLAAFTPYVAHGLDAERCYTA